MLKKISVFFILFVLLIQVNLWADSAGRIKGVVIDSKTGGSLPGANVYLEGTSIGTAADLRGEYTILKVTPGKYKVIAKYIGYEEKIYNIEILSNQTLNLNIELNYMVLKGKEVVVTAQAKGQMNAINQQISSRSVTNIVASDRIKEVPDVNAAESIGRLPGVSLKRSGGEGNKVVVRGLSPQYTIVEVEGVRLTGVDLDRSVGLSIISSEMLEGIELSKSLTPDKDADAIGGIVNLRLKEAKEGLHYSILSLGAYNDLETSFNNYKISGSVSNRFFNNKLGALLNLGQEQVNRSSDRFSASYSKNIAETNDLYTTSATVTENKRLRRRKHGSLMLDFKTDFVKVKFNNFYSQMENENESRNNKFRFNQDDFRFETSKSQPLESIRSHSLNNTFNIFNTELKLDFSYSNTKLDINRDNYNFEDDHVLGNNSSIAESSKLFAQPSSLIDEFFDITSGRKSILMDNVRSDIERRDKTRTINLNWKIPYTLPLNISGNFKIGGKYVKKKRTSDTENRQLYYWGGIGIGRVTEIYDKAFPDFIPKQELDITNAEGLPGANFIDEDYDYGEILNGRYELGWSADLDYLEFVHDSLRAWKGDDFYLRQGVESARDDYSNSEELTAGYIMAEINLGNRIMILPGVRYEKMHTKYDGKYILEDPFNPLGIGFEEDVSSTRNNEHWFPSINMKIKMSAWSNIRVAAYKSTSRPSYMLLSPSLISDNNKSKLRVYNPYLKPSLADNYDLGFSIFSSKVGLFTINGFYKEISDLVYRLPVYNPEYFDDLEGAPESLIESLEAPRKLYHDDLIKPAGTSMNNMPINNPNKAYFHGFEVSLQTNFWYLPGLLKGIVADINYSMILSETRYPYIGFIEGVDTSGFFPRPINIPVYETRKGRMIDQPASLLNVRIGWDYKGFSSRLSFRYQGETNSGIDPIHSLLDRKTDELFRIDFQLKQKITKNLSFTMDLANLNQFVDDAHLEAQNYIMPVSSEFYGFTSQFGLRYEF